MDRTLISLEETDVIKKPELVQISSRPTMLVVLGVHRSGTSVIARSLECFGAKNSRNLLAANPINPKGFFEDQDIYNFNELKLLPHLGASWHNVNFIEWKKLCSHDRSKLILEASEIIKKNYSDSAQLFVLKEPRISILLPFYLSVLENVGFEVKLICSLRDPLSVARSLNKVQGLSINHGGMLYVSNWLSILNSIQNVPTAFANYDEIITDPSRVLNSIANKLGIQIPRDFEKNISELSSVFIEKNCRHNTFKIDELFWEPDLPQLAIELYKSLLAANQTQSIEKTNCCLDNAKSLFAELKPTLLEYDRMISTIRATQNQIHELQAAIDVEKSNLNKLEIKIRHRDSQITILERKLIQKDQEIGEKEDVISGLQVRISNHDHDLDHLRAYLNLVKSSWSWRVTAPFRAIQNKIQSALLVLKRYRMALRIIWMHRNTKIFDPQFYLLANPDIKASAMNPFWHFAMYGLYEGRAPHSDFDSASYADSNPDIATAFDNPLLHYVLCGYSENRMGGGGSSGKDGGQAKLKAPRSLTRLDRPSIQRLAAYPKEQWPIISVLMPTHNTPITFLDRAINSVRNQTYPYWELCIADDGSSNKAVYGCLKKHAEGDERLKLVFNQKNMGISSATNSALALASGSFCAFLDHDDELAPEALAEIAVALLENPAADAVYTDQDKIDDNGRRFEPFHKPAWSPIYLLGVMYIGHLLVVRAELLRKVGGCAPAYDKVQDYELMLRLGEVTAQVVHIPKILYHWRALPGSIALSPHAKGNIQSLQTAAVQSWIDRRGLQLRARAHPSLPQRIQMFSAVASDPRLVSIIIPTKDAPEHIKRCLDTLFGLTRGCSFEVIVADTGTIDSAAMAALNSYPIKRIECPGSFNFSRVNNIAAREARGEFLLFLNNDTEVVDPDWLLTLLAHHSLPNVGAVGPILIYPHGEVQHAGVAIGARGTADHILRNASPMCDGYAGSLPCAREVSAVTAACMMMPRDLFKELGGYSEDYARHYQDTDLCLRIRQAGRSILHVGNVILKHHESASRGGIYDMVDRAIFKDRWVSVLSEGDPFYNPNFRLDRLDYCTR